MLAGACPRPRAMMPGRPNVPGLQRLAKTGEDYKALEAFYLREIRQVGDPNNQKHRKAFEEAAASSDLATAKAHLGRYIKDTLDQMTGKPLMVFGLDGKDKKSITSALEAGYRRFDCAESYGSTTQLLAGLIAEQDIDRDEYEVMYKFDVRASEKADKLRERLSAVCSLFDGRLDSLVIHNLDAAKADVTTAWNVMNDMKKDGSTRKVGVGNLKASDAGLLSDLGAKGGVDVVENSAASVLTDPDVMALIKRSGAELFYYDVVNTAHAAGLHDADGIKALMYTLSAQLPNSMIIMSSGDKERQEINLSQFATRGYEFDDLYDEMGKIDAWVKSSQACEEDDKSAPLPTGALASWLAELQNRSDLKRHEFKQSGLSLADWMEQQVPGAAQAITTLRVPARKSLKKRYVGMTLSQVLTALFGEKNCDWKWSIELVNLLICSLEQWEQLGRFMSEIVQV